MIPDFHPLFPNPHVLTILGNYWPRDFDFSRFPMQSRFVATEPEVQVLVQTQFPESKPRGELVMIHGLEGGGDSSYIVSLAHRALVAGYTVHRLHMRTCGGTEHLCQTLYHAGLTSDLHAFLEQNHATRPLYLIGFSLGGNVALKAAVEAAPGAIAGVCTVSAAIDLAASARAIEIPGNKFYNDRFVARMKQRLARTGRYQTIDLSACRTIYEIDDRITAPSFGMVSADCYYATQSSLRLLPELRLPTLMIAAQDDPMIPFQAYRDPAIAANPHIQLVAPRHGGHLGFLARKGPRFWADAAILTWLKQWD